ncbi:aldehyde dehydrogenase family protein [Geomesophilobacter sediminis]|uniref:Aldehyde dehydrogenase family protein n=1 Tax=Geomesophilobacter sediminis TaxID=2798584 RepID=A0A8J7J0F2_9BACT|nr:aldehyde dehydrogenase family protein [Geomesophilobacter sediminis]MBJ6723838.1 aldehyde dehydrogenase family protein [Geomesophilobacter sediminis]
MTITVRNFIAGTWCDAQDGRRFSSFNPARRDEVVAEAPLSSRADVDRAVQAARDAFRSWSTMPAPRRGEYLFRAAEILRRKKDELGELVTREMGKVLLEGLGDVQEGIDIGFYMGGEGRRFQGETVPSELADKDCKSIREPLGVVALVTPWNFPVAIPSWKMFAALICGNTVILKPSSETPACAAALVAVFEEAGIPPGVVNLVCGPGEEVGEYLMCHKDVDAASFTGSCAAGEAMERKLAELHRPVALEMGGKNAIVVMNDADLDLALEGVLWGAFGTTGQRCTATSRLLVQEGVYEQLLRMLAERASTLKLGNGLDPQTQVGPLVNESQCRKVQDYIRVGQQEGARLVTGGMRLEDGELGRGCFVAPTVFGDVTPGMRIAREEIFGPVLSVMKIANFEQAAAIVNGSPFGLSSSIYSSDVNLTARAEKELKTGIVYINASTIGAEVQLPFGGWRHSGSGHPEAGGKGGAIDFFTRMKVIYRDYSGKLQRAQIDTAAEGAGSR